MQFKNCLTLFIILFSASSVFAQVGIGTTNPSAVARMEVSSQTNGVGSYRGFTLPRVPNIAARDAIAATPTDNGLLVYVVDEGCLQMWNGIKWLNVACDSEITIGSATQNFEIIPASPNLPIYNDTGSGDYTTGLGDFPNTPLYVSGDRGFGVSNGAVELVLGPVDISGVTDLTFKLRLAGFANSQVTNGMDSTDTVVISISTTGPEGTFTQELLIKGGSALDSNNNWGFDATRSVTTSYDGDDLPTEFVSGGGNNFSTGGISYLEITGIPNSTNLAIKIEMLNNKANELWVIDDAQIIAN
ncbi:hypothetical protein [Aequorivita viscosa]|uniref:Uncharacterized protein n=1 Tax=Aequorivita viscosa TaxID=797419 RepID=A0A1M6N925_9FLAO|nr:hypothetical protein [Aequorivita viscosa]SDX44056.1 hypothetical protein SAMN05216556_1314 [Aequorivita viscosa]SHJ92250.1 hypothetical protein SAMN04487908_13220 [Aequorivita viscosa]